MFFNDMCFERINKSLGIENSPSFFFLIYFSEKVGQHIQFCKSAVCDVTKGTLTSLIPLPSY